MEGGWWSGWTGWRWRGGGEGYGGRVVVVWGWVRDCRSVGRGGGVGGTVRFGTVTLESIVEQPMNNARPGCTVAA